MHNSTQVKERKPKDRDFIRTQEGMFFCVTGYLHPPDRYTAYLKYSPDPHGKWKSTVQESEPPVAAYRREVTYYHASNVGETLGYLEAHYPHYIHDCPVRNFRFSTVPQEYVACYYKPQERLREILANPHDQLEDEAGQLALEIADRANINLEDLGVTGSILIELHNPILSDINLLVYGLDNAWKVRASLRENRAFPLEGLDRKLTERWVREMTDWFPLSPDEARYNISRRWNYGYRKGRFFGIHPTRTDEEVIEAYGDHIYRSLGAARIRAVITDARETILQPAIYQVSQVQVLEGEPDAAEVHGVVSYEGRYRDVAEAGQEIEARGKLESVDGLPGRLVIGTIQLGGQEYIKPAQKSLMVNPARCLPSPSGHSQFG